MEFNSEQLQAVNCTARNLLVLAGAGTGKTRTIIGRAEHLLAQGTPAERIAIITFTRRAAREIRTRLQEQVGPAADKIVTGTFHHFCLREMRARRRWFGFQDLTVMDRDDQLQLVKLVRGDVAGKDKTAPQANELVTYYSYARNTNQPVREYLEKFTDWRDESLELILKIFAGYKERKQQNGYLDYDDILHRFAQVMHSEERVCREVAKRYDHVLVDEMQDTNPLQWLILESLASHANIFCVGDDAQSIYAFRGADFRNVHSFEERLADAETRKLELNYRSTQEILDLANWLLAQSKLKYGKQLRAHRGTGIKPTICDFYSDFDEAEWVVQSIVERHRQGEPWREHMILCRTAYAARPIEAQLIERDVPYRFVGGIGLLQMAHVRDLLSAVRVAINHRDELGWMRYLMLFPRIGEVTAARLLRSLRECPDEKQALQQLAKQLPSRSEIVRPLQDTLKLVNRPSQALQKLAEAIEPILATKYDRWDARRRDFDLLGRLAERHKSLATFLETYTLDPVSSTEFRASEAEDDLVTLITVHSAKGTEAKVCYVASATPGNYPHARSVGDDQAVEEERRVLYVALTRAQDELFITRSLSQPYGRASWHNAQGSSYFLECIPSQLVQERSQVSQGFYNDYDGDVIRPRM